MRKVFANRWFILGALLTLSLSAFSLIAIESDNPANHSNYVQRCCKSADKGEFLWEIVSGHLHTVLFQ